MSRLKITSLAVLLLIGLALTDTATARPRFNQGRMADRTTSQFERTADMTIRVIQMLEKRGIERIERLYEAGKEDQAIKYQQRLIDMIDRYGNSTVRRMEIAKDRMVSYLNRIGEYAEAEEYDYIYSQIIEELKNAIEESLSNIQYGTVPEIDPDEEPETDPEIIDAE